MCARDTGLYFHEKYKFHTRCGPSPCRGRLDLILVYSQMRISQRSLADLKTVNESEHSQLDSLPIGVAPLIVFLALIDYDGRRN